MFPSLKTETRLKGMETRQAWFAWPESTYTALKTETRLKGMETIQSRSPSDGAGQHLSALKTETRLKGMETDRPPLKVVGNSTRRFENRDPLKGDGNAFLQKVPQGWFWKL